MCHLVYTMSLFASLIYLNLGVLLALAQNDGKYRPVTNKALVINDGRYRPSNDGRYNPANDGKYRPNNDGKYTHVGDKDRGQYTGGGGEYTGEGGQYTGRGDNGGQYTGSDSSGGQYTGNGGGSFGNKNEGNGQSNAGNFGVKINPITTPKDGWKIIRDERTEDTDGYHYLYETENGILAEEQGRIENFAPNENGLRSKGFYQYIGDDGVLYRVDYVADNNGFVPQGAHIPKTPPAIQKLLDDLASRS